MERDDLRFSDEVIRRFSFLDSLGFRCADIETTLVRFESSALSVNIYHGRMSYEIALEIEAKKDVETYSIAEILCLLGIAGSEQYKNYTACTQNQVIEGVNQLAIIFQKCIDMGLFERDTKELFTSLKYQRSERAEVYALETQLSQALRETESAWAQKDFKQVVRHLKPLQNQLDPLNLQKLIYAEKQVAGDL